MRWLLWKPATPPPAVKQVWVSTEAPKAADSSSQGNRICSRQDTGPQHQGDMVLEVFLFSWWENGQNTPNRAARAGPEISCSQSSCQERPAWQAWGTAPQPLGHSSLLSHLQQRWGCRKAGHPPAGLLRLRRPSVGVPEGVGGYRTAAPPRLSLHSDLRTTTADTWPGREREGAEGAGVGDCLGVRAPPTGEVEGPASRAAGRPEDR